MPENNFYKTVHDYIEDQSSETKIALYELRNYILEAVPDAQELFNYNIPAFALVKNGKRESQIMIAGYAKHVGFYPHPDTILHFSSELKEFRQGKGSIQFPHNKPIPKEIIIKMVQWRKAQISKKQKDQKAQSGKKDYKK